MWHADSINVRSCSLLVWYFNFKILRIRGSDTTSIPKQIMTWIQCESSYQFDYLSPNLPVLALLITRRRCRIINWKTWSEHKTVNRQWAYMIWVIHHFDLHNSFSSFVLVFSIISNTRSCTFSTTSKLSVSTYTHWSIRITLTICVLSELEVWKIEEIND